MALIDRYAVVQERDKLEKSLHQYLSSFSGKAYPELRNEGLCLRDLLKPENIEFAAEIHPWDEAIRNASNVLWENGSIELRYINKMIRLIQENQPYIMLADGVIVAHAGVNGRSSQARNVTLPNARENINRWIYGRRYHYGFGYSG